LEVSPEEIKAFYNDVVPESINKYANAFGTYDYPGIFYVKALKKEVIGIEFRPDDLRIKYPAKLKSITLDAM